MAGNTPQHELERLYNLIQQERLDEAASALRSIVRSDKDNEDVWWLLANAATDPAEAKEALQNVIRLNDTRQDAKNLLAQLEEAYPDLIPLAPEAVNFNPGDVGDPYRPVTPTPTITLEDDLDDWMNSPAPTTPAAGDNDLLDDWLAAPASETTEDDGEWMPEPVAPVSETASPSSPDDSDPFDFGEEDTPPSFATPTPVSPKHPQPEFHPEGFEGVLPVNTAGNAPPVTRTVATPVSADDLPPRDKDEEEDTHHFVPILMGVMLVVVVGIAAFYLLTNRTSDLPPTPVALGGTGTALPLPTFQPNALPTLDPNATLPTPTAVDTTPTVLPTLPGSETPAFALPATASTVPLVDASATPPPTFQPNATTATIAPTTAAVTTVEATVGATIAPASAPLAESLAQLTANFKTAGFADAALSVGESVLGKTLTVKVCSKPGIDLLRATDKVRDVIATEATPYRAELEALGVQIVACGGESILYQKVVPIRVATQYAEKKIDARKYRASWINP